MSRSLLNLRSRLAGRKTISEDNRKVNPVRPLKGISTVPYLSSEEIDYPKAPNERQIRFLQESWDLVKTCSFEGDDEFASPVLRFVETFYQRIFALEPSTVQLFRNFVRQAHALAGMLQVIIIKLDNADDPELAAEVKKLGAWHAHYGVKPDKLAVWALSLDYALGDRLRGKYSLEIGHAWRCAIAFLMHPFKEGMIEEMQTLGHTDLRSPRKQPTCTIM